MLKNLSDNLNLLMAKARLNSSELARLTQLPATTIKRIRNNEQANPTISTLLPIAKHFSITINDLLGSEAPDFNLVTKEGLHAIPLLSWRECIHFDALEEEKISSRIHTERPVSKKCYSLRVEEKDLDVFPEKSILIIEPHLPPESGDYIIIEKSGMASIKKYIVETGHGYLKSLVHGLGITELTPEYKILGTIIQYKVELKPAT